ncbi:nucleoside recognition domain-containing protein [Alphaproteobacteria bacterium]|nr:nucleoside recognition domain-containing protein [Alphaproteobacteria bacterium]
MNKVKDLAKSSLEITYELFIIMIPTLIVVKILDELGFVEILNNFCAPLMFLLGLPEAISLVFTTSMLTSPYAGLIVFSGLPADMPFTAAQASVLGLLILFTHSLPIEVIICRKAGVRARAMIFIRLGLGILSCYLLNLFFQVTGYMNYPATILLPSLESAADLFSWGLSQLKGLGMIFIIIIALVIILDFLKYIGVERLIEKALKPFLNFLGVGEKASTIAVVGVTLGIGFGAGLLIKEVKTGKLHYKDVFGVLVLVGMLHSIIEDTAVVSLIGSNIIITLFLRAVLTLCIVYIFMRLGANLTKEFWQKHLTNYNIPEYKPNS